MADRPAGGKLLMGARLRVSAALWALLALGAPSSHAQEPTDAERFPPRVGYVNDLARVVDPDARNAIEDVASEVRRKSQGDIVVVTLESLEGRDPDEIAVLLSRHWNVGYRGAPDDPANDTGVLVVLALEEREFTIHLQDGAKAFFPEAAIRDVVMANVVEPFRAGDYGAGLLAAVRGIAQAFAQHFRFELESGR